MDYKEKNQGVSLNISFFTSATSHTEYSANDPIFMYATCCPALIRLHASPRATTSPTPCQKVHGTYKSLHHVSLWLAGPIHRKWQSVDE